MGETVLVRIAEKVNKEALGALGFQKWREAHIEIRIGSEIHYIHRNDIPSGYEHYRDYQELFLENMADPREIKRDSSAPTFKVHIPNEVDRKLLDEIKDIEETYVSLSKGVERKFDEELKSLKERYGGMDKVPKEELESFNPSIFFVNSD